MIVGLLMVFVTVKYMLILGDQFKLRVVCIPCSWYVVHCVICTANIWLNLKFISTLNVTCMHMHKAIEEEKGIELVVRLMASEFEIPF